MTKNKTCRYRRRNLNGHETSADKVLCRYAAAAGIMHPRRRVKDRKIVVGAGSVCAYCKGRTDVGFENDRRNHAVSLLGGHPAPRAEPSALHHGRSAAQCVFATSAGTLSDGLCEQIRDFVKGHPDTVLLPWIPFRSCATTASTPLTQTTMRKYGY